MKVNIYIYIFLSLLKMWHYEYFHTWLIYLRGMLETFLWPLHYSFMHIRTLCQGEWTVVYLNILTGVFSSFHYFAVINSAAMTALYLPHIYH